jgi:hypothetical protein
VAGTQRAKYSVAAGEMIFFPKKQRSEMNSKDVHSPLPRTVCSAQFSSSFFLDTFFLVSHERRTPSILFTLWSKFNQNQT